LLTSLDDLLPSQVRLHLIDKRGVLAENGSVISAPAKPYNISVVLKVSDNMYHFHVALLPAVTVGGDIRAML
jgi:hypothetical protein